jgi:3-oxoacyl-[acyl-carrier-protein] synthase-3
MTIQIIQTGISQPDNSKGYIAHATAAANACLAESKVGTDEIDLLINVGNYRDDNMCEPSIAVLIQHALGINLNPLTKPVKAHTFSFDLMNGASGMLNALQVANAILSTKGGRYALLISGDSHPSKKSHADFPIQHAGAALLVERANTKGFSTFSFQTTPTFEGTSGYLDLKAHGLKSRHSIITEGHIAPSLVVDFATKIVSAYINTLNIDTRTTDLLVAYPNANIQHEIAANLNMTLCAASTTDLENLHTANLGFALHRLHQHTVSKDTLCVVIGTGITVGCGLYRRTN